MTKPFQGLRKWTKMWRPLSENPWLLQILFPVFESKLSSLLRCENHLNSIIMSLISSSYGTSFWMDENSSHYSIFGHLKHFFRGKDSDRLNRTGMHKWPTNIRWWTGDTEHAHIHTCHAYSVHLQQFTVDTNYKLRNLVLVLLFQQPPSHKKLLLYSIPYSSFRIPPTSFCFFSHFFI